MDNTHAQHRTEKMYEEILMHFEHEFKYVCLHDTFYTILKIFMNTHSYIDRCRQIDIDIDRYMCLCPYYKGS